MGQYGCKGWNWGIGEANNEMYFNSGDDDSYQSEIQDIFSVSVAKPK